MEGDGESAWRRARRSECGPGRAAPGPPCCERAVLALLVVLMLISTILQSVIIALRVAGSDPGSVESAEGVRPSGQEEDGKSIPVTGGGSDEDPSHRCPPDWIYIYQKCYSFSTRTTSQTESDQICTSHGSRLASVPETLISLRRIITRLGQEFWVRIQKPDNSWTPETQRGRWPDGTTEEIVGGAGSCVKLGQRLQMENCYSELRWVCELDAAGTRR